MGINGIVPVIPSSNISRDVKWYEEKVGFKFAFGDKMYAGIQRDNIMIHLQWHAGTKEDPMLGGAVVKIFVDDVNPYFDDLVNRGTVFPEKLSTHTDWNTHEFGFYDLNRNAIFFVEELD